MVCVVEVEDDADGDDEDDDEGGDVVDFLHYPFNSSLHPSYHMKFLLHVEA